jgi:hypothetical protein
MVSESPKINFQQLENMRDAAESDNFPQGPFMRLHLITGDTVDATADEGAQVDAVREEIAEFKSYLRDMMQSDTADGWELHMNRPGGGWAVFPRSSVLYIEFVGFGADEDV